MTKKIEFIFIFILLMLSFVSAVVVTEELTDEELSLKCLNESSEILQLMESSGVNINRPEDVRELIINSYDAQMILKERGRNTDFSYTLNNCEEIKNIGYLAFSTKDEILGLKEFYVETISEGSNTQEIDEFIKKIEIEYENERYERIEKLINSAYVLIIDFEARNRSINVFYNATKNNIKDFFVNNYKILILILLSLNLLFLIFRGSIKRFILNLKLNRLSLRRETIKELIKKTQKLYFSVGNISRIMYDIRLKKFSEIMRDIDRQMLNLEEELIRNKSIIGRKRVHSRIKNNKK